MHIDHSKLVELLTDASGIEKDKIEEQLSELVTEIQEAIAEGDAYEVDGLGVFSGIGNNVIFIPADELATEINYKYVGMEPIELESGSVSDEDSTEDDPKIAPDSDSGDEDDPFGGLLDDEDGDDEVEDPDASFSLDVPTQDEGEEEHEDLEAGEEEDAPFDLADEETDENEEDLETESPGPDKWGIDTYKDDSDAGMFSGLLGDKKEDPAPQAEEEDDDDLDNIFAGPDDEDDLEAQINKQLSDEKIEDSKDDLKDVFAEEEEDFDDDPFDSLEDESDDSNDKEEVVPVITNLASDAAKKKREEEVQEDSTEEEDDSASSKHTKTSRDTASPVLLWVILIIVIFAGGTYALGYFGVVNIPGVTPQPQIAATQPQQPAPQTQQPVQQESMPPVQETEPEIQEPSQPAEPQPEEEQPATEQPTETQVSESSATAPDGQPKYGLRGVSTSAANDGYTIVVFSLSKEGNARAKLNELNNDGYRALLASIPSQQYGQLWRVSLGQFESLRTAALAAETLEPPFSENYFITKIK